MLCLKCVDGIQTNQVQYPERCSNPTYVHSRANMSASVLQHAKYQNAHASPSKVSRAYRPCGCSTLLNQPCCVIAHNEHSMVDIVGLSAALGGVVDPLAVHNKVTGHVQVRHHRLPPHGLRAGQHHGMLAAAHSSAPLSAIAEFADSAACSSLAPGLHAEIPCQPY